MRHNLEKYDSYEMRTALLFGWGAFVLFFAAVLCNRSPDLGFATFTLIFGAILATLTAGYWFLRAFSPQVTCDTASEYAETAADEVAETAETAADPPQLVPSPQQLDDATIKARANFYAFVYGVCKQGALGEVAWEKRGLTRSTFRKWIALLEQDGIVSAGAPGQVRTVRKSVEEAMAIIAANSGDPDYWKPVRDYYRPNTIDTTLLILTDTNQYP